MVPVVTERPPRSRLQRKRGGVVPVAIEKGMRDPPTRVCSERGVVVPVAAEKGTRYPPARVCSEREGGWCL